MTLAGNVSGAGGVSNAGRADGVGTAASLWSPHGIALDAAGTFAVLVGSAHIYARLECQ